MAELTAYLGSAAGLHHRTEPEHSVELVALCWSQAVERLRCHLRVGLEDSLLALVALATVGVGPAQAAIPGANGKIAFTSNRSGNTEIYAMVARDGSSRKRLTRNAAYDANLAYSPNAKKIVFERDSEIYTMNALDGSKQRNRTNNVASDFGADWGVASF
jgi:hypothetical protein